MGRTEVPMVSDDLIDARAPAYFVDEHNRPIRRPMSRERRRKLSRTTAFAAAVLLSAWGVMEARNSNPEHPSRAQVAANMAELERGGDILNGTIYLGENVPIRTSPEVKDGDQNSPSNISFRVGKGKVVKVTAPLVIVEDGEHTFVAFEEPGSHPKTVEQRAEHLRYVSPVLPPYAGDNNSQPQSLWNSSYGAMEVNGVGQDGDLRVRMDQASGNFVSTDTSQPTGILPEQMRATTISRNESPLR